ncbi:MAG: sulfotransferase [Spirochaetes bacterium]|jgi:hypothetical protein|nr:sulfotransferase [Spirochaetota bacterium]
MNSPIKTTSTEYRKPHRPAVISLINLIGGFFRKKRFDARDFIRTASKKTGLDDFGNRSFLERMELLLDSIDLEARLHPFGRFMIKQNLVRFLSNRLKIEEAFKKKPEILAVKMEDPVFIIGLQRTGTTMLHRLIASDEKNFRFLASWEAINPAPLKEKKKGREDPRVRMALTAQYALKFMAPDFFAIHPIDARGPEEDCLLFDFDFWSTVPEATMRVPSFSNWLEGQDHTGAYEYYKKVLQYLQWQNPGGRWILKTPQHMEHFDEIFKVFPGAKIIQTHRDPSRVVASFCSMVSHAYGVFSDDIDPSEIGRHWSRKALKMVRHSMDIRDKHGADNFMDVYYSDLMKNPETVMSDIYGFLKIPFNREDADRVDRWTERNPQHKHGKHRYRLEDFGLEKVIIKEGFNAYMKRFSIPEEKTDER